MAAGTAGSVARADTHQQAGDRDRAQSCVDLQRRRICHEGVHQGRRKQSAHKRGSPSDISLDRLEQPRDHTADTGDAAIEQREQRRRQADQYTAGQGRPRCERIQSIDITLL